MRTLRESLGLSHRQQIRELEHGAGSLEAVGCRILARAALKDKVEPVVNCVGNHRIEDRHGSRKGLLHGPGALWRPLWCLSFLLALNAVVEHRDFGVQGERQGDGDARGLASVIKEQDGVLLQGGRWRDGSVQVNLELPDFALQPLVLGVLLEPRALLFDQPSQVLLQALLLPQVHLRVRQLLGAQQL